MDFSQLSQQGVLGGVIFGGAATAAIVYFIWTSRNNDYSYLKVQLPGLANHGNTCYMNSLLQALAACPSFVQWLEYVEKKNGTVEKKLLNALKDIIVELNERKDVVLCTTQVIDALVSRGWNISVGVEHDLYELFTVFHTTWEEEMKNVRILQNQSIENCHPDDESEEALRNYSPTISRKLLSFIECAKNARIDERMRPTYVGTTKITLTCKNTMNHACDYVKPMYDPFNVIALSIPYGQICKEPVTIEYLIRRNYATDTIRDATCQKCRDNKRKQNGIMRSEGIVKRPKTLLIRIERVGMLPSGSMKLSEHVGFREFLDLSDVYYLRRKRKQKNLKKEMMQYPDGKSRVLGGAEYRKSPFHQPHGSNGFDLTTHAIIQRGSNIAERYEDNDDNSWYKLMAVSEHRGGTDSGHFVTYRRCPAPDDRTWVLANDTSMTRVSFHQVAAAQAYMLFYERIEPEHNKLV